MGATMDKSLLKLSEGFRKGQVNRREFIQRVILSAGGIVAAGHVLRKLGFDPGLVREAQAGGSKIETMLSCWSWASNCDS